MSPPIWARNGPKAQFTTFCAVGPTAIPAAPSPSMPKITRRPTGVPCSLLVTTPFEHSYDAYGHRYHLHVRSTSQPGLLVQPAGSTRANVPRLASTLILTLK